MGVLYQTRVGMSCEHVRRMFKTWVVRIGLNPADYSTHSIRRCRIAQMFRRGEGPKTTILIAGQVDARSTISFDTSGIDEVCVWLLWGFDIAALKQRGLGPSHQPRRLSASLPRSSGRPHLHVAVRAPRPLRQHL